MDEFSIIRKYFKPLAEDFAGSLNLSDDAAILSPKEGCELVITKDALSQGVHFIGSEAPALIAGKALRVNLSDLAAMGAEPLCYFLALILPKNTNEEWLEKFASGLKQTQEEYNIHLAGGDTTATQGALSISITAIGSVPSGMALRRNGAKIDDDIYVSGTIGDAALGLGLLQSGLLGSNAKNDFLISRYLTPQPRVKLGMALRGVASSAMDISDGLMQDLGHICTASGVGSSIYTDKLPLSTKEALQAALGGGDDYELLFTAAPDKKGEIKKLAKSLSLQITCIGKITAKEDVSAVDEDGVSVSLSKKGFLHF